MNSHKKTRKVVRGKHAAYTKKQYQSKDGMLTTVWGSSTWHMLHTMSFNYPTFPTCEEKRRYRDFVYSLQYVLPCGKCRKNLKKNFKKLPLQYKDMENRAAFSKYIYRLHELINTMLGKKSGLSYNDVRDRYEGFRARCAAKPPDKKSENGCTEPLVGEKAKCVLHIVPQSEKCETFQMDKRCQRKV